MGPKHPICHPYKQIQDAIDLVDHTGVPYTPEQTVSAVYTLIERTGILEANCKKWREKARNTKTWAAFQTFFWDAHKDWEKYAKQNGVGARYGQAHAVQPNVQEYEAKTIAALANFATSTASDRAALSKLTDTVQKLTAELKIAREKIDDLQQQLANAKRGKRGRVK